MPQKDHDKYLAYQRAYHAKNKIAANEKTRARQKGESPEARERRLARGRAYAKANRKSLNAYSVAYYNANRGGIRDKLAAMRKTPEHKKLDRNRRLKRNHGIDTAVFDKMVAAQGGLCAICSTQLNVAKRHSHVDHDHGTGSIRGVLCHGCNVGLGCFGDDVAKLAGAIAYLKKHKQ